jgi:hypothetical protein
VAKIMLEFCFTQIKALQGKQIPLLPFVSLLLYWRSQEVEDGICQAEIFRSEIL